MKMWWSLARGEVMRCLPDSCSNVQNAKWWQVYIGPVACIGTKRELATQSNQTTINQLPWTDRYCMHSVWKMRTVVVLVGRPNKELDLSWKGGDLWFEGLCIVVYQVAVHYLFNTDVRLSIHDRAGPRGCHNVLIWFGTDVGQTCTRAHCWVLYGGHTCNSYRMHDRDCLVAGPASRHQLNERTRKNSYPP